MTKLDQDNKTYASVVVFLVKELKKKKAKRMDAILQQALVIFRNRSDFRLLFFFYFFFNVLNKRSSFSRSISLEHTLEGGQMN